MITKSELFGVNLIQLLKALLRKIWIIILSALILAGVGYAYTYYTFIPTYQASIMLYVNNSSTTENSSKTISQADLNAAQSLVDSYMVILRTRTTLQQVIDRAGVEMSYQKLNGMITAGSVSATEFFRVTVTSTDPNEAEKLANTIGDVLPERIPDIVEGSSVKVVDPATLPTSSLAPDYVQNTLIGALIGIFISAAIIIIKELSNKLVTTEEYLRQTYTIPVLAAIPDMSIIIREEHNA